MKELASTKWCGQLLTNYLFVVSAAIGVSCSTGSGAGSSTTTAGGLPASADREDALIQQYIDYLYKKNDVMYSFRTRFGEDVDCIDFYAQPALRDPRIAGQPIPTEAPALPGAMKPAAATLRIAALDGERDDNGRARTCPEGTVPFLRVSAEKIKAAGGLSAMFAAKRRSRTGPHNGSAAPPASPGNQNNGYQWVTAQDNVDGPTTGMRSTLGVFAPKVPNVSNMDHSASQIWTMVGRGTVDASGNCDPLHWTLSASDCRQSVEIGWDVDPTFFQDAKTHLFIFSTQDGYGRTGCLDANPDGSNRPWMCPNNSENFIRFSRAVFIPGQQLDTSPGSEITVQTYNPQNFGNSGDANWWVYVNDHPVGYYPRALFGPDLSSYGTQAGGEVFAPFPDNIEMGNGTVGVGFGLSAYQRNVEFIDFSRGWPTINQAVLYRLDATDPSCYDGSSSPAAGGPNWGAYFYFGGGSDGNNCSPDGCPPCP